MKSVMESVEVDVTVAVTVAVTELQESLQSAFFLKIGNDRWNKSKKQRQGSSPKTSSVGREIFEESVNWTLG